VKIEISKLARKELDEAVLFYELAQAGLGVRFKVEVRKTISRIQKYPKTWPLEREEVRKCFVHRFPYKVLYSVQDTTIVILAIAHQHRKPGFWIEERT